MSKRIRMMIAFLFGVRCQAPSPCPRTRTLPPRSARLTPLRSARLTPRSGGEGIKTRSFLQRRRGVLGCTLAAIAVVCAGGPVGGGGPSGAVDSVMQAEGRRVEMIQRAAPSVVCIFDRNQRGGGSGVLIDPQGYGLTNYHVVAGMLDSRRGWGGLSDGKLYDLEVLGIDPTGDVAMFRLTGAERFPYVNLGDSDAVRVGDTAVVMGNAFTLSEDYTPSVTVGLVTGVHRYQKGTKGNLTYTDCIQVDASVNPGNSGGPLFNAAGEVIGINGRISVNTRGRYNVGLGYAISSNQIARFVPALRAGLLARHGTLQATVDADPDGRIVFQRIAAGSNAERAGIGRGDTLLTFDGVAITSGNHYASLLGTYPADWPVPIEIEQGALDITQRSQGQGQRRSVVVRLDAVNPKLRRPFEPQREVNVREVERVLRAFARATLGSEEARRPMGWKWTLRREFSPSGGGNTKAPECYEVSQTGDGPVRMQRRYEDGSLGPTFVGTERKVTQHLPNDETPLEPSVETEMTLEALYIMQHWLLAPVESTDLTVVHHVGGDRYLPPPGLSSPTPSVGTEGPLQLVGVLRERVLEVIEWAVGEHALAKFAFEIDTGLLKRIRIRDVPTGEEVTLDLLAYRDIGGVIWPCLMIVNNDGRRYWDTLSNWELTP